MQFVADAVVLELKCVVVAENVRQRVEAVTSRVRVRHRRRCHVLLPRR